MSVAAEDAVARGRSRRRRGGGRRLALIGAIAFGGSAVLSAPASLLRPALDAVGERLAYERIEGAIWRGRIRRVTIDGVALGDVDYSFNPAALALGRAAARVRIDGALAKAVGRIDFGLASRSVRLRSVRGDFNLAGVKRYRLLGAPFAGTVRFDIEEIAWRDGAGCLNAAGNLWTDALSEQTRRLGLGEAALQGPIACIGEDLRVSLRGANEMGSAFVNVDLRPDRTYALNATVEADRAELRQALELAGFRREAAGLVYNVYGPIKGIGS